MLILFINYYIDYNRSSTRLRQGFVMALACAKCYEVYVYQGIKHTRNLKDGKCCKINKDGTNTIIEW